MAEPGAQPERREQREQRLVFGEDAELYDRARPGYPAELFAALTELAGGALSAVDVGCGTGKATVGLAGLGWTGIAVDPDPAMAEVARRRLASYPPWRVEVGEWETWPTPEPPVDLVVCAQAWHWLDPTTRLDRAWRALAPAGLLALFWNRPEPDQPDESGLRAAIEELYRRVAPGLGSREPGSKGEPPRREAGGEAVFEAVYRWTRRSTAQEYVDTLRTQSDHRLLQPAILDELLGRISEEIQRRGGHVERDHRTDLWVARRPSRAEGWSRQPR